MSAGQSGGGSGAPGSGGRGTPPRRRLAGIGFVLLGAYFATSSADLRGDTALWPVLVLVGLAVAAYGVLQLLPPRR